MWFYLAYITRNTIGNIGINEITLLIIITGLALILSTKFPYYHNHPRLKCVSCNKKIGRNTKYFIISEIITSSLTRWLDDSSKDTYFCKNCVQGWTHDHINRIQFPYFIEAGYENEK